MSVAASLAMAVDPAAFAARTLGLDLAPWQVTVLRSDVRRMVLNCSRQAGKSTTVAAKAMHTALYTPGSLTLMLSPSLRQSMELFKKAMDVYRSVGQPVPAESETKSSIELANGSRILSLPGSERTTRGYTAPDLILVDEAAQVEDALLYAVLPMMAANPNAQLVAMSTPYGKRGWFSDVWHAGGDDWQRHEITVYDVPHISADEIETFKRLMPAWWFQSEFECAFLDPAGQVFASDMIAQMVQPGLSEWDI